MKQTNQMFRPMGRQITIVLSDCMRALLITLMQGRQKLFKEALQICLQLHSDFNTSSSLPLPVCELSDLLT